MTDGAPNIKLAVSKAMKNHVPCFAHNMMNLVLNHTLEVLDFQIGRIPLAQARDQVNSLLYVNYSYYEPQGNATLGGASTSDYG